MRLIRTLCVVVALLAAAPTMAPAQNPGDRQPNARPVGSTSTTMTLTSDTEVRRHYNGLQQALRQLNADELQRLYDEYRAARAAISDENAERSATLLAENRASHEALRREEPNAAARARRTDEIQAAYAAASAERQDWYLKAIESLESRYASDRAERRGLLDTEISVLSEQMNTALARLRAGADRVTAPAMVSLPGGAARPGGSALPGRPALPVALDTAAQSESSVAEEESASNGDTTEEVASAIETADGESVRADGRLVYTMSTTLTMRGLGAGSAASGLPDLISTTVGTALTMRGLGGESNPDGLPDPISLTVPVTLTMRGLGNEGETQ